MRVANVTSHQKIRIGMIQRRLTAMDIAREIGVTRGAVAQVICGIRKTARIRVAIAEKLGTTPGRLWPKGC